MTGGSSTTWWRPLSPDRPAPEADRLKPSVLEADNTKVGWGTDGDGWTNVLVLGRGSVAPIASQTPGVRYLLARNDDGRHVDFALALKGASRTSVRKAMAAGLPVVIVGGQVPEGCGFSVPADAPSDELVDAIIRMASLPGAGRRVMGRVACSQVA